MKSLRVNNPRLLAFLWMLFLVRGLFYISFVPLWEGFDEWAHYAVVQNIATGGHALLSRADRVSREVQASLELAPRVPGGVGVRVGYDAYWQLPDIERANRERLLRSVPMRWASEPATDGARVYEASQTPLYYWLSAALYKLIARLPFLTRVWLLRFFGLLVGSTVIPLGFLVARKVFGEDRTALGVVALIAAMPQLMMTVSHISNDCMAVAMGTLLLWVLFQWKEEPDSIHRIIALGTILGLALLTKAYFLALVPPVLVFVAIWAKRKNVHRRAFVILLACTAAISAWWYVRTWILTHSFSGNQTEMAGNSVGLGLLAAIFKLNWRGAIDFAFLSHLWLGNWSFLVVRSWMYHFFALFAVLAGVGLLLRLVVHRNQPPSKPDLLLLVSIYASFLAALGYYAIRIFQSQGFSGATGFYLYPIVVAEAILLIVGLEAITPATLTPAIIPGAVICLAALELFGTHFYAIAYYTGFTAHLPNGNLPALRVDQLRDGGFHVLLTRLATDKPEFLGATVMAILWALFLAATFGLIGITLRLAAGRGGEGPRPANFGTR